jgi:hypothetical protein
VVWKTTRLATVVNVNGPRYGALLTDRRLMGFNNVS